MNGQLKKVMGVAAVVCAMQVGMATALAQCSSSKATAVSTVSHNMGNTIVDTAVKAGSFTTLVKALKAADLVDTLNGDGPFTVFAPTDEAFAKLPDGALEKLIAHPKQLREVLLYHVVAGKVKASDVFQLNVAATVLGAPVLVNTKDGVKINDSTVIKPDVTASNGVIHVIDAVLLPPGNIVETASKAGKFNTLLAAAKAAGLAETLASDGPFTVFAPTDAAFAKLPDGTVESLLADPERLAKILKYHVVKGNVVAGDVVKMNDAKTLLGQKVKIATDGGVKINNAKVVATDVLARNGVIHVIDTVLLPE